MKKLLYFFITVILGALVLLSAPKTYAQTNDAQEFSINIYGEARAETNTITHRNDTYYRVAIPEFLALQDLQKISYRYLYEDQITSVTGGADNDPFVASRNVGFLGAYSRFEYSNENMDLLKINTYFSGDLPHILRLDYYQNENVIYEITENTQSASLNYFYVLKDAVKTDPSEATRGTTTLISLEFIFTSTNVGDVAYFEGYDAGYDVGYNEGLIMGAENAEPQTWSYNEENNLVIVSNDGTKHFLGYGAYDEAYNQGVASDANYGFGWVTAFLGAFSSIFAIELLPHLTIGLIVGIPIGFRLVLGIIRIIRGG